MMQEGPLVSVCMTAYNQERYIAQAIESVLAQRVSFPIELVIGEDRSADLTGSICEDFQFRYPSEIRLHRREANLGFGRNFCLTWDQCEGRYVAILEGDDFWCSPDKLASQVALMESHREYSMCFTLTNTVDENGAGSRTWPYYHRPKTRYTLTEVLRHNPIANCSVMYRRAVVLSPLSVWYPWIPSLPVCDMMLHGLHGQWGPIGYIHQPMATYRLHSESAFESKGLTEKVEVMTAVYAALAQRLRPPYCHQAGQSLTLMHQGLALWYLGRHNFGDAWMHWRKAVGSFRKLPLMYRAIGPGLAAEEVWHLIRSR